MVTVRKGATAVQEIMIKDADSLTPDNPFHRVTIDAGHSPFASRPDDLAAIINAAHPLQKK